MKKDKQPVPDIGKIIADKCVENRKQMGLSCDELAHKIKEQRITIWRFEQGISWPRKELLMKILNFLNIEIIVQDKSK